MGNTVAAETKKQRKHSTIHGSSFRGLSRHFLFYIKVFITKSNNYNAYFSAKTFYNYYYIVLLPERNRIQLQRFMYVRSLTATNH
jgi:hypothetical protein